MIAPCSGDVSPRENQLDGQSTQRSRRDYAYYEDGAYTSIDLSSDTQNARTAAESLPYDDDNDNGDGDVDAEGKGLQDIAEQVNNRKKELENAYARALLVRFDNLRRKLRSAPPTSTASKFSPLEARLIHTSTPEKQVSRTWSTYLSPQPTDRTTPPPAPLPPKPTLLTNLPQLSILIGLSEMESLLLEMIPDPLSSSHSIPNSSEWRRMWRARIKIWGAWTFSLLAQCRKVGEMDSEDVGILRDLGKVAVRILTLKDRGEDEEEGGPPTQSIVGNVHGKSEKDDDVEMETKESETEPEDDSPQEEEATTSAAAVAAAVIAAVPATIPIDQTNGHSPHGTVEQNGNPGRQQQDQALDEEEGEIQDDPMSTTINTSSSTSTSTSTPTDINTNTNLELKALARMIQIVVAERYGQKDLLF